MSEPLLTGKPSLLCQGNFEVRIRALEEHLKEIETKLQTITRLDLKPTELMKLPKEERDEILNMTFHPESKMTELEAENGEVCDRCGEVINRLEDEVVYNICASCFATNEGNKSYQVLEQELADAKAELQKISFAIGCDGHPEDVIGNIRELKAEIDRLKNPEPMVCSVCGKEWLIKEKRTTCLNLPCEPVPLSEYQKTKGDKR